ncbi:hypothetical protein R3P38DRAFT_3215624 [Favolaschia claudopus]|uniref:Uncharacterized protein n=1 Tax=Favolaschia claudopus TaxID=2862362 RepID=A0AAW0A8E2_9AGAR
MLKCMIKCDGKISVAERALSLIRTCYYSTEDVLAIIDLWDDVADIDEHDKAACQEILRCERRLQAMEAVRKLPATTLSFSAIITYDHPTRSTSAEDASYTSAPLLSREAPIQDAFDRRTPSKVTYKQDVAAGAKLKEKTLPLFIPPSAFADNSTRTVRRRSGFDTASTSSRQPVVRDSRAFSSEYQLSRIPQGISDPFSSSDLDDNAFRTMHQAAAAAPASNASRVTSSPAAVWPSTHAPSSSSFRVSAPIPPVDLPLSSVSTDFPVMLLVHCPHDLSSIVSTFRHRLRLLRLQYHQPRPFFPLHSRITTRLRVALALRNLRRAITCRVVVVAAARRYRRLAITGSQDWEGSSVARWRKSRECSMLLRRVWRVSSFPISAFGLVLTYSLTPNVIAFLNNLDALA